jgi:hypothetical protein
MRHEFSVFDHERVDVALVNFMPASVRAEARHAAGRLDEGDVEARLIACPVSSVGLRYSANMS